MKLLLKEQFKLRKNFVKISIITLVINYLLDISTKLLAINFLKGKETLSYLGDSFVLQYVENDGAFLGMGSDWSPTLKYIVLLGIPLTLCLFALYYAMFKEPDKIKVIIIVSIISGGLGNLVDRMLYDFHVVDFLNFGIGSLRTGILNVADMSVTFGVIALVFYEYFGKKKKS